MGTVTPDADFCDFVVARQAALRRAAWLLTGDVALAEDLVQTALVRAWPHWAKLDGPGDAEAYVRRVLVTTWSSWWRRRWRGEVPGRVPDMAAPDAWPAVDLTQAVRTALLSLPPRQRAAVVLRYVEDLSEAQTAHALGCSVGTVKSSTARALNKLRSFPGLGDVLTEGAER